MAKILINTQNYKDNLNLIVKHLGDPSKLALVLKDNAYGHDLALIAKLANQYGVESVFVKNIQEAEVIKNLFPHISIFYGDFPQNFPSNFHPVIQQVNQISSMPAHAKIELKINIRMNRNGIALDDVHSAFEAILKNKCELFGVFAHNGYGDEDGVEFDASQNDFYETKKLILQLCKKYSLPIPRFHSLSSSGALRSKNIEDDLVRIGIASYGYVDYNFPMEITKNLKPVLSLWAKRITTRHLPKGSRIGYGGVGILQNDGFVSTYDIGYGDGIFRYVGYDNRGSKAKLFTKDGFEILPKISMDCFSALCDEEEICVFEDVTPWCELFGTIPYDILTKLSSFLPRVLI